MFRDHFYSIVLDQTLLLIDAVSLDVK